MGAENKSKVDEWLTEDSLMLIECWARDNFSQNDIAEKIGIPPKTLSGWKYTYPQLKEAMQKGKEIVDYRVENALLKRALGYKTTEVKTIMSGLPDANGNRQVRIEKTEKEIPPDSTSCLAWLNNRKPEEWKRNRDNIPELNDDKRNITINIVTKDKNKTIDDWEEESDKDWDIQESKSKENTSKTTNTTKQEQKADAKSINANAENASKRKAQKASANISNDTEDWDDA